MSRLDLRLGLALSMALLAPACGDDGGSAAAGDTGGENGGSLGAGQGGAQDFGQFKQILEEGRIPGPETLDDVGFFNEHKIDLPPATCAGDVCLHGLYGEMGNMISGTNCITVLVGLNTAIDVKQLERPPLNLALVIDSSGSMEGEPMQYVREGLLRMLDALDPADRITLVDFDTTARVMTEYVTGSDPALIQAIGELEASGGTNIYDGLRTGFELMAAHADPGRQNRVVFLSDGMATEGITNDAKILAMAQGYSEQGYGLTTIGVGADFDVSLMRTLSEQGSGAFYFLEDPAAVQEVFVEEVTAFLVPLAEDVTITADIVDNYSLRAIRGTKLSTVEGNHGAIEIPNLQLAHRETVDDHEDGRRGGGGAILLELLPRNGQPRVADVGELKLRYRHPVDKQYIEEVAAIKTTVDPGEIDLEKGVFDNPSSEKGFVMLNIYVGFDMAATRAAQGDLAGALNILDGLDAAVDGWLAANPDFDIEDDLKYIRMFMDNLVAAGATADPDVPLPVPEPWPDGD
ncbi:VWA domain-containing protein [Nannocystis sp. SCPEA4]|uniref:vWA domain-containing protein n=1 Tax=Nannocystis sp. SCPEA4 TaxID=2996787 RepID=UPI00226E1743|nr:VWA domain-containing protein [Nannocystis sp. SCPEA4]MCY1057946.1 VWA domain-containing protein [Nannocystis sp. SCPEA4]